MLTDWDFAAIDQVLAPKDVPEGELKGGAACRHHVQELLKYTCWELVQEYKRLDWCFFAIGCEYDYQRMAADARDPNHALGEDGESDLDRARAAFQELELLLNVLEITIEPYPTIMDFDARGGLNEDPDDYMDSLFLQHHDMYDETIRLLNQCACWGWDRELRDASCGAVEETDELPGAEDGVEESDNGGFVEEGSADEIGLGLVVPSEEGHNLANEKETSDRDKLDAPSS